MQARLSVLAEAGRTSDCVALMQELGDWMAAGRGEVSPLMYASFAPSSES